MASLSFRSTDKISKDLMKAIQEENIEMVENLSQEVIELLKSKNNADNAMGQKKKKEEGEQKVDKNDLISLYMVSK